VWRSGRFAVGHLAGSPNGFQAATTTGERRGGVGILLDFRRAIYVCRGYSVAGNGVLGTVGNDICFVGGIPERPRSEPVNEFPGRAFAGLSIFLRSRPGYFLFRRRSPGRPE